MFESWERAFLVFNHGELQFYESRKVCEPNLKFNGDNIIAIKTGKNTSIVTVGPTPVSDDFFHVAIQTKDGKEICLKYSYSYFFPYLIYLFFDFNYIYKSKLFSLYKLYNEY